jgi:hypothetical protein
MVSRPLLFKLDWISEMRVEGTFLEMAYKRTEGVEEGGVERR